jgi:predicted Zn-dependent peptidase
MRVVAAAVASLLVLAADPHAAAAATAVVDVGGGAHAYVRTDPAAALCGITIFVRAGLDREAADGNGLAALVAESIIHTPVNGTPVADAIAARGGSLSYSVSAQYVRFYLEAKPSLLPALATLAAGAFAHPSFDETTLGPARTALASTIAGGERDPRRAGIEMLRTAHYTGSGGFPTLGSAATLAGLGTAQAQAFYASWYARGDAFATVVGGAGPASDTATRTLIAALPAGTPPSAAALETRPFGAQPRRIVTSRDIASPFVVIGFAAPSLGDPDFPAVIVMRTLLGDILDVPSATTLPAVLRNSGTLYTYDMNPSQLSLWFNGGRVDPQAGLTAIDAVLKRAASQPLEAAAVTRFDDRARGEWILDNLSLEDRGWEIGNAVAHGLDADAAAQIGDAISHVTPADLQRVAKKYFQQFDVALVVPRNGPGG